EERAGEGAPGDHRGMIRPARSGGAVVVATGRAGGAAGPARGPVGGRVGGVPPLPHATGNFAARRRRRDPHPPAVPRGGRWGWAVVRGAGEGQGAAVNRGPPPTISEGCSHRPGSLLRRPAVSPAPSGRRCGRSGTGSPPRGVVDAGARAA